MIRSRRGSKPIALSKLFANADVSTPAKAPARTYMIARPSSKPISTVTLNDLCRFLDYRVEDVLIYIPEE